LVKGKEFELEFRSPILRSKEKQQVELLLQFLESTKNYCVCIVDLVGSTSIAMGMSNEKISTYYGVFLNLMAKIASSFDATIVKNIGDSLLYYFPKTDSESRESFKDVLECSITMIQMHPEINARMHNDGLPDVNYRISCEFGSVIVAKMSTSSVNDIFGTCVNLCSKINLLASPNSIIIGKGLYEQTKSFDEYIFTEIDCKQLSLGKDYQVYSVSIRDIQS
jgi:class 3 adenylate cyclase